MFNTFIKNVLVLQALIFMPFAHSENHDTHSHANELLVYKSPTCGCCKKWISHLEQEGIVAHSKDYRDISIVKLKLGIPANMRSCHTAVSKDGYAFEGHVPAKYIENFLSAPVEGAIGLSVPGMPLGSPGMEMNGKFTPYNVMVLFKDGTSEVYAKVNSYEEQF